MFTAILTAFFLLAITLQAGYVLFFFAHVFERAETYGTVIPQPVTVIICARNEAQNLRKNLPIVLSQRYENEAGKIMYEVVVVNDMSGDDTEALLAQLAARYPHLHTVNIPPDAARTMPGKKFALGKGVRAATADILLMTDADCMPAGKDWLRKMVAPLLNGKKAVLGVGKYTSSGGWLNAFIRWETLHTFLQFSTYSAAGHPYMAVGRNFACRKSDLLHAERSENWTKTPSGDDDLLVNIAGFKGDEAAVVIDKDAMTFSPAKQSLGAWKLQKQRHMSTGKYYRPKFILLLGIYACSHALMWLSFFMLLFTENYKPALGVIALRCAIYWLIWGRAAAQIEEKGLGSKFLLFDIGWMIYNFAFSPYVLFKNKQAWK